MAETTETLLRDQSTYRELITSFLNNTLPAEGAPPCTGVLKARLAQLDNHWSYFMAQHVRLNRHSADLQDDEYFSNNHFDETESTYFQTKAAIETELETRLQAAPNQEVQNVTQRPSIVPPALQLHKIAPPKFDGDPLNWETFKERFSTMVKDVPGIPAINKLHHLLASLEGDAAKAFKNTRITGANFNVVWQQLLKRYDQTRVRLDTHLSRLISVLPAKRTAADLTRLINSMQESIRALTDMDRPVEFWDDWFVHLAATKLDPVTREDWEKSREATDEFPTFTDIVDFLENRAHTLRAAYGDHDVKSAPPQKPQIVKKKVSAHATHVK